MAMVFYQAFFGKGGFWSTGQPTLALDRWLKQENLLPHLEDLDDIGFPISPSSALSVLPPTFAFMKQPGGITGLSGLSQIGENITPDRVGARTFDWQLGLGTTQSMLPATNGRSMDFNPMTLALSTSPASQTADCGCGEKRGSTSIPVSESGEAGVLSATVSPAAALPAFPGAEGFGANATGGRGGQVIYVTTTAASGPGSLQWAIDQPGPKYILFKVSGLIDTRIHLRNGDVTIAGHTSPGGITVRGFVTDETPYQDQEVRAPSDFAENWILQHIRIRPGLNGPSDDGLRLRYTRNAIVDHVSVGNATDEAVEISYSNNITIQNSMLAETLGDHSFYGGMLINYSNPAHGFALDNLSIHHNLFNRIEGRLPEASRESLAAADSTMNLELSSNLYWDPRFFIALGANTGQLTDGNGNPYPIYYRLNAVNNYFRTGSSFPYGMWDDQILRESSAPKNQLYVQGNRMSLYPTRSDYALFYCCNDYAQETNPDNTSRLAQNMAVRHDFPTITYTQALDLPTVLPNRVGAWPRDPMDTRLLQPVRENRIDSASPSTNPAGDALLLPYSGSPPPAPTDSDNDGMPDTWEVAKGLNPNVSNHNDTNLSTLGYTNLEVYLHELAANLTNPGPSLAIAATNASQTEGDLGGKAFTFTVTRSGSTSGANAVNWAVTGSGTNPANATDFAGAVLPSGTISFAADETSKVITVDVQGDTTTELDETFTVTLSNPTNGATLTTASATGTITNDDLPVITIAATDAAAGETNNQGQFTLTRTGSTAAALTVNLSRTGTATNGTDYPTIPATTSFAAGSSTAIVNLTVTDDLVVEGNETAILTVTSGTGYTVGTTASATVTITDNDVNGSSNNDNLVGDSGQNALNGLAGSDNLNGGAGNDLINGGAGGDMLTGGTETDTFIFQFGQSLSSAPDRVTDFAIGTDKIDLLTAAGAAMAAPVAFSRAANNASATLANVVSAVFTDANGSSSGNQALGVNSAALVVATASGIAGTYLIVNDGSNGFQSANDLVINLTGYSGSLPGLGAITPLSRWFI